MSIPCLGYPESAPGRYVAMKVSDTGRGMPVEVKEHLFEPFFTTKELGKGTGLGLATIYGIVRQNKGSIKADSAPGRGMVFTVLLPVADKAKMEEEEAREDAAKEAHGGGARVMFVEDKQNVLRMGARVLQRMGFEVKAFDNGHDALNAFAKDVNEVDILVTDVIMPGMNGKLLAEKMLVHRPDLKVLYTSGYTENIIVQEEVTGRGLHFLAKPYTPQAIVAKINEVLCS